MMGRFFASFAWYLLVPKGEVLHPVQLFRIMLQRQKPG